MDPIRTLGTLRNRPVKDDRCYVSRGVDSLYYGHFRNSTFHESTRVRNIK